MRQNAVDVWKKFLMGSCCIVLSGCAISPPDIQTTVDSVSPQQWETILEEKNTVAPEVFWAQWNDPLIDAFVAKVLQNSPKVEEALASLQIARAAVRSANSVLWPSFSVDASAGKNRTSGVTLSTYKAGMSAAWEANLAGAQYTRYDAALFEERAKAWALEQVKDQMVAEVVTAYVNFRAAQLKLQLLQKELQNYQETAHLATWKSQAGLGDQASVETAQVQVENAKVRLVKLQQSLGQYKLALARLLAIPSDELHLGEGTDLPSPKAHLAVAIPAEVLMRRPDIRSAIETLYARAKTLEAAQKDFFPSLQITGSIGTQAATVSALGASGTGVGALVAAMSLPVLNWGTLSAASDQAKAQLAQAQASYRDTLVSALEETGNALLTVRTTEQNTPLLQQAQEHAQKAYQLSRDSYQAGLGDYLSLLEAERNYFSAQENALDNRAAVSNAYVTLYRVLGGPWTTRQLQ